VPHSQPTAGISIATGKKEVSLSTEKLASHRTDSLVSLTGYCLFGFPTSSSHLTIPSTMGRQNPTNGCAFTLSPSSWQAATMTYKCYTFPWRLTLCHSPGLISCEPTPLVLGDSSSVNFVKIFAVYSPTRVPRTSSGPASSYQTRLFNNTTAALPSYEPKSMTSQTGR
jgi:hypothetical protein